MPIAFDRRKLPLVCRTLEPDPRCRGTDRQMVWRYYRYRRPEAGRGGAPYADRQAPRGAGRGTASDCARIARFYCTRPARHLVRDSQGSWQERRYARECRRDAERDPIADRQVPEGHSSHLLPDASADARGGWSRIGPALVYRGLYGTHRDRGR